MTFQGTGKTYAAAFAMRELNFKKVLFLVHRGQLARQTKKSFEKVFAKSASMRVVGGGSYEYDAETQFYYMGQFEVTKVEPAKKKDNNGTERDITKFQMKLHHPVREDLLRYLQSYTKKESIS